MVAGSDGSVTENGVHKSLKTANVADVTVVTLIRNIGSKVQLFSTCPPHTGEESNVMEFLSDNPIQPNNLANAPRCGAKTRSGGACRSPAVRGKQRCRMHGGTNNGAPKGNNNAKKHGNRSAEAEAQLKIVRRANLDLRVLSKFRDGLKLSVRERDRLVQMHAELLRAERSAAPDNLEPKKDR